jgi:hypothetical protein
MSELQRVYVVPIAGMVGYGNGPQRVEVGDVIFTPWNNLEADWNSLGFNSDPVERLRQPPFAFDLEPTDVVGVVKSQTSLDGDETRGRLLSALRLLIACNPAWAPNAKRNPPLPGLIPGRSTGFIYSENIGSADGYRVEGSFVGPLHEVRLDGFWESNQKSGFLEEMRRVLSGEAFMDDDWRGRLLDATSLLGHSRLARTDWESFLFSMIGMERLLKKSGQAWNDGVGQGVENLFSWLSDGRGRWYSEEIRKLYKLRNLVVHEGAIASVQPKSAKIADEVLFNLLLIGYKHLDEVRSLDNLIERARRVASEIADGVAPTGLPNAMATYSSSY